MLKNILFWKKQEERRLKISAQARCLNGLGRKPGLNIFVELRIPLNDGDETARKKIVWLDNGTTPTTHSMCPFTTYDCKYDYSTLMYIVARLLQVHIYKHADSLK